jgi:hypothetical protein
MLDDDRKECFINEQKVNKIIIKKFLWKTHETEENCQH